MRLTKFMPALAAAIALSTSLNAQADSKVAIVPHPSKVEIADQAVSLPRVLTVGGDQAQSALRYMAMRGLNADAAAELPFVVVSIDSAMNAESYILDVAAGGIKLTAADQAGLMYGIETLTQILDQARDGSVPACRIEDSPRLQYRGFMLDVVRCYLPIDEVKKMVDMASRLKINKFHLHMTDDNGWRIEIKKYPKLTEVGAWRVDREELFPARPNPKPGEPTTYGGFYTQDQLRELVEYAAERNVEIIPEIEMPAHSMGAIASYPELACPVHADEFRGVLTGIGGKNAAIIMCAGNDSTLQFFRDVIDEVMDIFPSQYIHLGGDEAVKTRWEQCPRCNQRLQEQNLSDFEELQGWFMDQIISYVREHGKTAIGWDEVTYGKPKEDIVIMGWQGTGSVAEDYAAQSGRRFIMTPARYTYLIRYQGPQWFEPFTYFGNITLRDIYEYEPVKPTWKEGMKDQLLGMQASMWTEFCRTPQDVQYMVFPRLIALADAAWRPEGTRDWAGFIAAADNVLQRFPDAGMDYSRAMFNIQHHAEPTGDGKVKISAECIRPDSKIMYTFSDSFDKAIQYSAPLTIAKDQAIKMVAKTPGHDDGKVLELDINFNKATGATIMADSCTNGLANVMLNGLRGSKRNSDFEWAGWHNSTASFVVDLGQVTPIRSIKLGALANANMNVALPSLVKLYLGGEDGTLKLLKEVELNGDGFPLDPIVYDIDFGNIHKDARYVKFVAYNRGSVPDGYPREGNATWLYFDEIIIK